eukprot:3489456-Amphidinium_carterae.1
MGTLAGLGRDWECALYTGEGQADILLRSVRDTLRGWLRAGQVAAVELQLPHDTFTFNSSSPVRDSLMPWGI